MTPQVTLYGHARRSPNPPKVMIMLEELGVEYAIEHRELGDGPKGVKAPDFLKINPNGRIPALIDHTNNDLVIWESGAILLYLAERFDTEHKFSAASLSEHAEVWEWLMFQMSGLGPSQGQANWFLHYHAVKPPELHPSVLERYQNECRRIYGVLEKRLAESGDWLAVGRFSIVDMAHYPWLVGAHFAGLDFEAFPTLKAYIERIRARDSVQRAYAKMSIA